MTPSISGAAVAASGRLSVPLKFTSTIRCDVAASIAGVGVIAAAWTTRVGRRSATRRFTPAQSETSSA